MRIRSLLFITLLIVVLAPSLVSAQVLSGVPFLSSLASPFSQSTGCGEPARGCDLAVGVGYLWDPGGTRLDLTLNNAFGQGVVNNFRHTFPLEGLWLGVDANIAFNEQMTLMATGTWLFPSNGQDDEDYFNPPAPVRGMRTWRSSIQYYTLGIGAAFAVKGPVAVLGGFRFDSFQVGFSDPQIVFNFNGRPTDEADLRVSLYIPYVGLAVGMGSSLKMGVIGFPYLPGDVKYGQTIGATGVAYARAEASGNVSNGYFMEVFLEGGTNVGGADIGVFGKWQALRARATTDVEAVYVGLATLSDSVDVGFYRQYWVIGGKFALNFVSPL